MVEEIEALYRERLPDFTTAATALAGDARSPAATPSRRRSPRRSASAAAFAATGASRRASSARSSSQLLSRRHVDRKAANPQRLGDLAGFRRLETVLC